MGASAFRRKRVGGSAVADLGRSLRIRLSCGMSLCRALLGLALLCLAGCAAALDSEQLRLCRAVLPALHPDGTGIREIRHGPAAPGGIGIRIDYATQEPGQAARARF